MQAVMMVAGKSTRTYPLTLTRPKPLLPILNNALIFHNLDQLVGLVEEVILIVGYRKEMIAEVLRTEYQGMKIIYQEQREQLGTGHAVLQARPHIDQPFLVMNGDDLFARADIQKLLSYPYAALAMPVSDPSLYGVYQIDEQNRVVTLIEKPKEYIGKLANVGCYVFQPAVFERLENTAPSERGEIEITTTIQEIALDEPVHVIALSEYWLPTGYPWDLLRTQNYLFDHCFDKEIQGTIEDGVKITGKIAVGRGSVIRSGSRIHGPVIIGKKCEIGFANTIGPYTSIGSGVNIGPHCLIDHSLLMNGCHIDANCIVQHSVLGENVRLGDLCHLMAQLPGGGTIHSLVKGIWIDTHLNQLGASIADDVSIGSRSVVMPGCKIWPGKIIPKGSRVEQDIQ